MKPKIERPEWVYRVIKDYLVTRGDDDLIFIHGTAERELIKRGIISDNETKA